MFKRKDEIEGWQEFPWETAIIKTDVLKKWSKVDMKLVLKCHAHFDPESGKFGIMQDTIDLMLDDSDEE